jgi:hypothetical protein
MAGMITRKLSPTGDSTFGQGLANFWINSPFGVGQEVETTLRLFLGEWYLDTSKGTPWTTKILGYGTSTTRDLAIKTVILQTPNVVNLESYSSTFNPTTRQFTVTATILTAFSQSQLVPISVTVNIPVL